MGICRTQQEAKIPYDSSAPAIQSHIKFSFYNRNFCRTFIILMCFNFVNKKSQILQCHPLSTRAPHLHLCSIRTAMALMPLPRTMAFVTRTSSPSSARRPTAVPPITNAFCCSWARWAFLRWPFWCCWFGCRCSGGRASGGGLTGPAANASPKWS